MEDYGLQAWTMGDYQSFVHDLSRVRSEAQRLLDASLSTVSDAYASLPAARAGLPRNQRFAGKGNALPVSAARAQVRSQAQADVLEAAADLLDLLDDWTSDRFNARKYRLLMARVARAGANDIERAVKGVMVMSDGSFALHQQEASHCWLFNLAGDKRRITEEAFSEGQKMTNAVVEALSRGLTPEEARLFSDYFRVDATDRATLATVSHKFAQIQSALNGAFAIQIVIGPGAGNLGRDSMAYVRPAAFPSRLGALIFLGPDFWLQQATSGGPTAAMKRGATLVHEASHLFANTDDVVIGGKTDACYGRAACVGMTPEQAINNADTYCLFAQELQVLRVRGDFDLAHALAELDAMTADLDAMLEGL